MNKSINDPKLISICIPLFNEADNVQTLFNRLCEVADSLEGRYNVEFIFSDNHSDDGTWEILSELAIKDPRIRAIRFARDYGFQRSILLNFMQARGDAVMQLDADMQDPPEMLKTFIEYWEKGYLVVYGIRRKRAEGALSQWLRTAGYWAIDKFSEHSIPRNAGDFRLIDRKVVESLEGIRSSDLYLRGSIADLGVQSIGIEYDRSARKAGTSKFSSGEIVQMGIVAMFNHSVIPLRLAVFAGIGALVLSIVGTIYYLMLRLWNAELPEGLASIHILVLFAIGLNSLFLGIIGEYVRKIFVIMQGESSYLIESTLNVAEGDKVRGVIR